MAAPQTRSQSATKTMRKRHHRGVVIAPLMKSLKLRGLRPAKTDASATSCGRIRPP